MPSLNTKLATAPNVSANYVLKATTSTTIGNSLIFDNGTNVGIGNTNTTYTFDVTGTGRFTGALNGTSATFSSYVSVDGSTSSPSLIMLNTGGNRWELYPDATAFTLYNRTGSITPFKISNAGAATFSSTVQTGGNIRTLMTGTTDVPSIYAENNVGSLTQVRVFGTSAAGTLFGVTRAGWSSVDTNNGLGLLFGTTDNAPIVIGTANTERMRITSGGEVLIGTTSTQGAALSAFNSTNGGTGIEVRCTGTSGNSVVIYSRMSTTGSASNYLFAGQDGVQDKIYIYGNGNIVNRNGSYGTLSSDIKLKQDIVDANSQWDDIKNLRIVNFRYIEDVQKDGEAALKQIGFIAQEVEQVSPSLVYETKSPESEDTWKSIKTSIIHLKALKALQEAMAKIEELETKLQDQQQTINSLINR